MIPDSTAAGVDAMADQQDSHRNPVLCDHVRAALGTYLAQLNGENVSGLHALVMTEVERPLIQTIMEHCGHNQSRAAQMLGLSRSTLRKKLGQYGLE